MSFIALSDIPGAVPGTAWKAYEEVRDNLYTRVDSDKAYEDIMNGLAYLGDQGRVVYYESDYDY
ncbi:MAG TPA: hypothetical protein VFT87_02115 [Candidatus Saccharimonadales bacterium]|nr:hypothetical protein [Candidatus Saccharimonadales bacterium]